MGPSGAKDVRPNPSIERAVSGLFDGPNQGAGCGMLWRTGEQQERRMRNRSMTGAFILIVLGILFLLSNLGWLPRLGPLFAQWWPLILIIVGVSLLVRRG